MKILVKTVADPGPFFRLGRGWTKAGVVVEQAEFSDDEWALLAGEPMLHVGPAPDEAEIAQVQADDLGDRLKAMIAGLEADSFGKDGKPRLDALRAALPEAKDQITAELRDQVWAGVKPVE